MGLIICLLVIGFVSYGLESRVESSILGEVNAKLREHEDKEDPYQYWDMPC